MISAAQPFWKMKSANASQPLRSRVTLPTWIGIAVGV